MSFTPSQDLKDARLDGGILAFLNAGTPNAYAVIFDGSAVALVTLVFAKPFGVIVAHELVAAQADLSGDQIIAQGNAAGFALFNGAGVLAGTGDVSDLAGTGALKVQGTTGTLLYAGARAILGELKFV